MKTYIIASTEYEANMPDLFLMDENGNYYGVSQHSYAQCDNFPKDVNHWAMREGSDKGRNFNIDCVDLDEEKVNLFNALTAEYAQLDAQQPTFGESCPLIADFKSMKSWNKACDEYNAKYLAWAKESNLAYFINRKREVWKQRTLLFCSFSSKVYDAIKFNDNIRYA